MRHFKSVMAALAGGALMTAAGAALAQAPGGGSGAMNPGQRDVQQLRGAASAAYGRESEARASRNASRSPAELARERRLAQAAATAAGTGCDVKEARTLGRTTEGRHDIFEIACDAGPGFIVIASEPPQSYDCLGQAGYAAQARAADPNAEVGLQCELEANQNAVAVVGGYARDAGLDCRVDEALATGVDAYEVGCAGRDGWLLQKRDGAWVSRSCWMTSLKTPGACLYSTREENAAEWPRLVAGSDAAACVPAEVEWMGDGGDRGSFYEIRCASGDGIIVRFKDDAAQQTYSCIDAPQIFRRPCNLTRVE